MWKSAMKTSFDVSGSYSERYQRFGDAIKARYPQLQPHLHHRRQRPARQCR